MTEPERTPLERAAQRFLDAAAAQRAILREPEDFRPGMGLAGVSIPMAHQARDILANAWPGIRRAAAAQADADFLVAMSELAGEITAEYQRRKARPTPPTLRVVATDQEPVA